MGFCEKITHDVYMVSSGWRKAGGIVSIFELFFFYLFVSEEVVFHEDKWGRAWYKYIHEEN